MASSVSVVRLIGPLRERDFALFWAGTLVSLLGDGIYLVALPFTVLGLGGGAGSLSIVGLAWSLGMVGFLLRGRPAGRPLRQAPPAADRRRAAARGRRHRRRAVARRRAGDLAHGRPGLRLRRRRRADGAGDGRDRPRAGARAAARAGQRAAELAAADRAAPRGPGARRRRRRAAGHRRRAAGRRGHVRRLDGLPAGDARAGSRARGRARAAARAGARGRDVRARPDLAVGDADHGRVHAALLPRPDRGPAADPDRRRPRRVGRQLRPGARRGRRRRRAGLVRARARRDAQARDLGALLDLGPGGLRALRLRAGADGLAARARQLRLRAAQRRRQPDLVDADAGARAGLPARPCGLAGLAGVGRPDAGLLRAHRPGSRGLRRGPGPAGRRLGCGWADDR